MLPIRLSELPEAPLDVSQSGIFPVSDVPNDITYKLSLQQIPSLSANQNIQVKTSSYTITKNDYNTILYFNNVDNDTATLTIPSNNSKRIQPGYSIKIIRYNTGNVQIVPENNVLIYSDKLYLRYQYSVATLTKIDTNKWILTGDLSSIPVRVGVPEYIVSGSNDILYNGNYYLDPDLTDSYGTPNSGTKVYKNQNNSIFIYFNDGMFGPYWWIGPVVGNTYSSSDGYYYEKDFSEPLPSTGWLQYPIDRGGIFIEKPA